MKTKFVGVDIGGANLKFASLERSIHLPFQLWQYPQNLSDAIRENLYLFEPFSHLAVTMTGELADCFESRRSGVTSICESVRAAVPKKPVLVYQTTGQFVDLETAIIDWQRTAASNWHATANLVRRSVSDAVVIDIGSTTTDIIPIRKGEIVAEGCVDFDRLINSELVYTGVGRTPISAMMEQALIRGRQIRLASEYFANVNDAFIVLGFVDEDRDNCDTADGRPADQLAAHRRLAKMMCLDEDEVSAAEIYDFAEQILEKQVQTLTDCISHVANRNGSKKFVVLGAGEWLARRAIRNCDPDWEIISFVEPLMSVAGPAYAVCKLAEQSTIHQHSTIKAPCPAP